MALLRPRLGLGLVSRPSVASSSRALVRGIRSGRSPHRASDPDKEEEGPVIALGGPPPPPPPPPPPEKPRAYSYTNGYSGRSEQPPSFDSPSFEAPRYETPRYDAPPYPPHTASYEPPKLERDSEVVAPADVNVKVEGAPRSEDKAAEPPLLLSADAPPEPVPRIAPPAPESDTPEPPRSSSDSTTSSESTTPSKEEWERKYEELQTAYNKKMGELRASMDERMKRLAVKTGETLALVSQKVNEVTGYREVERLKQSVKNRGELGCPT